MNTGQTEQKRVIEAAKEQTDQIVAAGETEPLQSTDVVETPASERIAKLFGEMMGQKQLLVAIIDFCRDEHSAAEIDEMLAPLQEYRRSIYTPSTIRRLLERAGALEYLAHDEEPEEQVDESGNLVVPEKPEPTWLSTAEALEFIEMQNPFADLVHAIEPYDGHIDVFRLILEICNGEGVSISTIENEVHQLGIQADDKLQAGFFVGKLEDYQAIEWRGAWITTELGMQYLEHLAHEE